MDSANLIKGEIYDHGVNVRTKICSLPETKGIEKKKWSKESSHRKDSGINNSRMGKAISGK